MGSWGSPWDKLEALQSSFAAQPRSEVDVLEEEVVTGPYTKEHHWRESKLWSELTRLCGQSRNGEVDDETWATGVRALALPFHKAASEYQTLSRSAGFAKLSEPEQDDVRTAIGVLSKVVSTLEALLTTASVEEMDASLEEVGQAMAAGDAFQRKVATKANREAILDSLANGRGR